MVDLPPDTGSSDPVLRRIAVRAVIVRGDQVLLLQSRGGDVKFPGGGVEPGEEHREALTREILEETGFTAIGIGEPLAVVTESHADVYDESRLFEMSSFYYAVEVGDTHAAPELTASEHAAGLHPVWLTWQEAIHANLDAQRCGTAMTWVTRETDVLQRLASGREAS